MNGVGFRDENGMFKDLVEAGIKNESSDPYFL